MLIYTCGCGRNYNSDLAVLREEEGGAKQVCPRCASGESSTCNYCVGNGPNPLYPLQYAITALEQRASNLLGGRPTADPTLISFRESLHAFLIELDRDTDRITGKKVCAPAHVLRQLREVREHLDDIDPNATIAKLDGVIAELSNSTLEAIGLDALASRVSSSPSAPPLTGTPFVRCPVWSSDGPGEGFHCARPEGHQGEHSREIGGEHPYDDGDTP